MYHSITFGTKNSYDDWHLVATSRPLINPPTVKTKYVDIPGANGSLDLTQALTGSPAYNNREGAFEFYVLNGHKPWQELYSEIMQYLHGKEMRLILEDDPDYYYTGRFFVASWTSDKDYSRIAIQYNLKPFKYSIETNEGVL